MAMTSTLTTPDVTGATKSKQYEAYTAGGMLHRHRHVVT